MYDRQHIQGIASSIAAQHACHPDFVVTGNGRHVLVEVPGIGRQVLRLKRICTTEMKNLQFVNNFEKVPQIFNRSASSAIVQVRDEGWTADGCKVYVSATHFNRTLGVAGLDSETRRGMGNQLFNQGRVEPDYLPRVVDHRTSCTKQFSRGCT